MCAPSITMLVPSVAARSISALMPTATAAVCSRKPSSSASDVVPGGSRSAWSAWNDDVCRVGISSDDSIERITSRIASVATTRTMPSRAASCVAIVDLPTPVVPPIRITSGTSRRSTSRQRRKFFA